METKKLVAILLIFIVALGVATLVIAAKKPEMHKMIMFERIIFIRGKK